MPCRNRFRKALKRLFNSVYSYRLQIVPATEHVCLSTFRLCPAPDFVRLPASKRGRIPSGTSTEPMPPSLRHPVSLILIQVFALLVVVVDIDDTDALVRHDLQLDLILPHPAAAQRPQAVIQVGRNVRADAQLDIFVPRILGQIGDLVLDLLVEQNGRLDTPRAVALLVSGGVQAPSDMLH